MKINYWHYWFEKYEIDENGRRFLNGNKRYYINLPKLLKNFSDFRNISFKKQFREDDETDDMLILSQGISSIENTFMFLKTRYSEIYKTIKDTDLSVGDIENTLRERGESIAFASYFAINSEIITMASTLSSPTIKALSTFIEILLRKLGTENLVFKIAPVCGTISRDDIEQFDLIGETEIKIPIETGTGRAIFDFLTGSPSDQTETQYITVKLSMKRGGNLKENIKKIIDNTLSESDKFKLKAKSELDGKLVDYFLTEQGQKNRVIPKPTSDINAIHEVRSALYDDSFSIENLKQGMEYEALPETHHLNSFIRNNNWNDYLVDC